MNILLVSTTALGDTVMATPFLRAVRKRHPEARITMFAHVRRMEIFSGNPHADRLLPYFGKGKGLLRTLAALRRGRFDLAIILHANDPDIVPLVRWTGAPMRVGWGESRRARLLTHTILRTHPPEHFMLHKKRLLESVGIPVDDLRTELFLDAEDEGMFHREAFPWLKKASLTGGYVAMHAFGSRSEKWWPLENFFEMARRIRERQGLATAFIGDAESALLIRRHPRFDPALHFAPGGCSIRESAVLIRQACGMLTTDSGPMHLAFAVRCPTLGLFGPTKPALHGPCFDQERHLVLARDPLAALTVEEVAAAWDRLAARR
ncbi:MAG: glycosyltransferase family 9 protein [Verrucomicrobiae bacterium]|nr:glycosyltransferase family 9 protein [Verrucomicrobiae bacterium]